MQDLHSTSYLPRAEPSTRPGGVSRSRTEPLAPRAKGPAAPSTLTPVRACQPSGILESTAQVPAPIPTAPQALGPLLQIHLVGEHCVNGGYRIFPGGDGVLHFMFVEFIINVFHIDFHINNGSVNAGDGALGGHDGVA